MTPPAYWILEAEGLGKAMSPLWAPEASGLVRFWHGEDKHVCLFLFCTAYNLLLECKAKYKSH